VSDSRGWGQAKWKEKEDMCVAVAFTKNRWDGSTPIDSIEGKQSPIIVGGQMTLAEGGEAFDEWEQGEELARRGKLKGGICAFALR
jgi:hypothetical protein